MGKRARIGTPSKGQVCDYQALQRRLSDDMESKIKSINNAIGTLKVGAVKEFREVLIEVLSKHVVPLFVDQGSLISDLIEGISGLEAKVEALQEEREKDAERIT